MITPSEDQLPWLVAADGMRIPPFGIGTHELRGDDCTAAVETALRAGVRLIDTAAAYHNETLVAKGIKASGVPRSALVVVVKIAPKAMGPTAADVAAGVRRSVQLLEIDYADVVLLHWPGCGGAAVNDVKAHRTARRHCWEALEQLRREGIVRHAGVSNFAPRHFASLAADGSEKTLFDPSNPCRPVVNQIELHPLCVQKDVCDYCRDHGILLQQYSPLAKGNAMLLEHPTLCAIVKDVFPGFTVPDVLIMWGLCQGFCVLVKCRSEEHLKQNLNIARKFFAKGMISDHQMQQLRCLRESMGIKDDHHFFWHSNNID
ncbi:putative aldo/keto reductase [Trypanosoma theileri]|uniref:Putative aldo/keto reductase n=1 Tax=Trypanosoma theileri TaxID=67003 RepID=A0A1X0NIH1_9TRYP|nr:putative aldo/keto reductase [Trypanosoma theileri]ORC84554.1 putative aldo/keto reductase [Trypanosoma theileri]